MTFLEALFGASLTLRPNYHSSHKVWNVFLQHWGKTGHQPQYPVTIMTYQRSSAPVPSSPQSTGVDRVPVGRILRQCCPAAVLDGGCGAGGVYSTHTPTWAQRKGFSDGQTQSPVDRPGRPPGGTVQLGGKSKGTFQEDW